jgi:hypothetical protein
MSMQIESKDKHAKTCLVAATGVEKLASGEGTG